jgi:hypothetical protein
MLGQSAERLSQISMGIHEELGQQNKWVCGFMLWCIYYYKILYDVEITIHIIS